MKTASQIADKKHKVQRFKTANNKITPKQLNKTLSLFSVKYNDSIKKKNYMNYSLELFGL